MVRVGQVVPNIEVDALINNEKTRAQIADYRGKWLVLLFYPADFTFICPTELSAFADKYQAFVETGAEVASVSTDTVWSHKAWKEMSPSIAKIEFPMFADQSAEMCRAFGTYDEVEGLSIRGTFIIDPKGVLKAYELNDNDIGRNVDETLRKLQAAVYVSEADGEVCPASWQPGEITITPGLELVGQL